MQHTRRDQLHPDIPHGRSNSLRHPLLPPRVLPLAMCIVIGIAFPATVQAFSWQPTPLQYALLPDHCKARLSDFYVNRTGGWTHQFPVNEERIRYWRNKIGADYSHMHHYCAGLGWLMQAKTLGVSRSKRGAALRNADGEISYTLKRSNRRSPIWIEMHIAKAQALTEMRNYKEAIQVIDKVLADFPSQPLLHVEKARILEKAGATQDAITVLEDGLGQVSKRGPLLFYLARYYFDVGNVSRAAELTELAEAEGMKMESLRQKLGQND